MLVGLKSCRSGEDACLQAHIYWGLWWPRCSFVSAERVVALVLVLRRFCMPCCELCNQLVRAVKQLYHAGLSVMVLGGQRHPVSTLMWFWASPVQRPLSQWASE